MITQSRFYGLMLCVGWLSVLAHGQAQESSDGRLFLNDTAEFGFFEWEATYGRIFFVQYSHNLKDWFYYPQIKVGDDNQVAHSFEVTGQRLFFRLIHMESPPQGENPETFDIDGDGMSNMDELLAGSDPFASADANGNSVPDDWEFFYGTSDLEEDADGDGLTALQEYELGLDPTDYFNGVAPIMEEVEGLPDSLSMRVTSTGGALLVNAPVLFESVIGGHLLATTPAGQGLAERIVRTGSDGIATVYFVAP